MCACVTHFVTTMRLNVNMNSLLFLLYFVQIENIVDVLTKIAIRFACGENRVPQLITVRLFRRRRSGK